MNSEELDRAMRYWDRYSGDQLSEAFGLVKNPENWKLPIDAVVPGDTDRRLLEDAIIYYAGSLAEIIELPDGRLHVLADGYYADIGS